MQQQTANIWYVQSDKEENPLQPDAKRENLSGMYIREMNESEKNKFPIKGIKELYSIHDETGQELGVTDNRDIAFKLAEKFGMKLNNVH